MTLSREYRDPESLGTWLYPDDAVEPIFGPTVRDALRHWMVEIMAEEDLAALSVEPRRRALLFGPPGCGKTTMAHHVSARLGIPMLVVRADELQESFLGATSRNIAGLFSRLARQEEPALLFFDEIDSLAERRGGAGLASDKDDSQIVNTLLQQIQAFRGYLVVATNRHDCLDPAFWRRFDLQIEIPPPNQRERVLILQRYLAPVTLPDDAVESLARTLANASPALIEQFCENVKRQIVLAPKLNLPMTREAFFDRVLSGFGPHPDMPAPPLWEHRGKTPALAAVPWPLPLPEPERADADA